MTGISYSAAMSPISLRSFSEYTAPVGLLGLMTTMALVRLVILSRSISTSGLQSSDSIIL